MIPLRTTHCHFFRHGQYKDKESGSCRINAFPASSEREQYPVERRSPSNFPLIAVVMPILFPSAMQLILVFCLLAATTSNSLPFTDDLDQHWRLFKNTYRKSYTSGEEGRRRRTWEGRVNSIANHNLMADVGLHSYRRGLNKYSDMTREEYMRTMYGFKIRNGYIGRNSRPWRPVPNVAIPKQVDYRDTGLVTPVKDQGSCGSCWAFSATGALEGQHKKKTGQLVSLSEQNLIDCNRDNHACLGGSMDVAFEFIKSENGIDTENSYPYKGRQNTCAFKSSNVGATCTGHVHIPSGNEEALKQAVATVGPVSVGIDAHHDSFHDYKAGVYDEPKCGNKPSDLVHAVLVVGYGTEEGKDYWLVKNSWGKSFGMNGYIKMSRNKNNQCGIATAAIYPLV
ncbi:cathepsin L [Nephila pilipes]|uniref:Cathepsin L n=1 Tax=Nephila pilipes TaxID=299642 RepID=A0A8X6R6V9_NEPPI|nr:cathepsin L [Nephila pilipes]